MLKLDIFPNKILVTFADFSGQWKPCINTALPIRGFEWEKYPSFWSTDFMLQVFQQWVWRQQQQEWHQLEAVK